MDVLYNVLVMKVHIEADPKSNISYWYSDDKKFYGAIVEPFNLDDKKFPAGALLSVPKYTREERPSINKYSPLIVQSPTVEGLIPMLERWTDENAGKTLWSLRRP